MLDAREEQSHTIVELSAAAGGLAHEIRNVLSTLRMNLQLLDEDWTEYQQSDVAADAGGAPAELTRRSRRRIGTLLRETQRLESILEDFLQFISRRELKRISADLSHVVAEVVEFFMPQADAANIHIELAAADAPLSIFADVGLLKQALLNLLINAQQAMTDGGRLSIALSATGGFARIDVTDTGPGIAPDQIDHVFDAYYSTKKGGTGLGLTMARRMIRAHGGDMTVRSDPPSGACFTVTLPLTDGSSGPR